MESTALLDETASPSPSRSLAIARDPSGKILPAGDTLVVASNEGEERVTLPQTRALFRRNGRPGDLSRGPTPELLLFFMVLESTVVRFCNADGRDETDQEMERVFAQLRRRPDSPDSLLHSYLRAAARLYMSTNDVSQAEYEAVMGRLAKSARTFSMAPISRNYLETLRETLAFE